MSDTPQSLTGALPPHVEDTVRAIAQLHAEHRRESTPLQRLIDRATARAGTPAALVCVIACSSGWVIAERIGATIYHVELDAPPFGGLQTVLSALALCMTVIILTTQRREDQFADQRAQLTLQLAMLSERKNAKIIELIEELRRDSPTLRDRVDEDADHLAAVSDPRLVLDAIKETHAEAEQKDR